MAHLSVRRGVVVPRTASWTPTSVWTAPAFCRPSSISASSKRADLVQRQPSQTPRSEIAHTPAALVHSGALERGGSTRVEHAVWGFQVARIDLRNDITAGQRLEQVSGGGLAHPGHTPSTSGSRPDRCLRRALSSANIRNRRGRWFGQWGSARHDLETFAPALVRV